jgi:hypothetical protein
VRSEVRLFPDPPLTRRCSAGSMSTVAFVNRCHSPRGGRYEHGAVAQLGEHLLCKQGVTGSIPVSSTTPHRSLRQTQKRKGVRVLVPRFFEDRGVSRLQEGSDLFSFFGSLTIWNDPSIEVLEDLNKRRTVSIHMPQTFWGYMVKRISAYGGCLGGKRR